MRDGPRELEGRKVGYGNTPHLKRREKGKKKEKEEEGRVGSKIKTDHPNSCIVLLSTTKPLCEKA